MRKKISFFLLLALLLTSVLAGCGGTADTPAEDPEEVVEDDTTEEPADVPDEEVADDEEEDEDAPFVSEYVGQENTLIFGDTTGASGDWEQFWTNNAMDAAVLELTHKQATMEWDFEGAPHVNETAVENLEITENEDGSATYTWTIKDGLVWSDGSPITAEDYVSGILLKSAPQMVKFKSKLQSGYYLKGFEDFYKGNTRVFEGVRLIDDKTFALTVDAQHRPNFYEQVNASSTPFKLSYWLGEENSIKDDGEGCYFDGEFAEMINYGAAEEPEEGEEGEEGEEAEEGEEDLTADLTPEQQAIFDKYNEMIQKARFGVEDWPSSGPYTVKSFDEQTKEVVLVINEKYPGNFEGVKPSIGTVVIQEVQVETAMDQLKTGQITLLTSQMSGDEVNAGLDMVDEGGFDYVTYPRAGYGLIDFKCDVGPTRFVEVRQAIAKLLDRDDFVQKFTGGFGSIVHGPYGEGQWFYQETKDELLEQIDPYSYEPAEAVALLEQAGYTLNEAGEEYQSGDGLRYRDTDGELEPLIIKWSSSGNEVSKLLTVLLAENPDVVEAGIKIEEDQMDFTELLNYYYREASDEKYASNDYNMFNLATNFNKTYDRTDDYTTDPEKVALGFNGNYILDEELDFLANDIVKTDPNDPDAFKEKFVKFIVKWNELLPQIPLYSNEIHDFFSDDIVEYQNSAMADYSMVILYARMAD